jgi:cytochrome d ubiquinol oxidase subunit I
VTEVGRQPWTVFGLLRTADSVSPSLSGTDVLWSLLAYMTLYLAMYPAGVAVILSLIRRGPTISAAPEPSTAGARPQSSFNAMAE